MLTIEEVRQQKEKECVPRPCYHMGDEPPSDTRVFKSLMVFTAAESGKYMTQIFSSSFTTLTETCSVNQ